jgi:hypothetical protein
MVLATVQVAAFFLPLLNSVEAPVVLEAAKGLLGLARLVGRGPGTASVGPSAGTASTWAPLAVSALIDLWGIERLSPAHAQIMDLLSSNICTLQVNLSFSPCTPLLSTLLGRKCWLLVRGLG